MIEIEKDRSNEYSFVLKAEGGHALLRSIVYSKKEMAEEAIRDLQTLKRNRNTFERRTNHNGEFLFSIKNKNGRLIGNSELYQSEAGMENGIKNLIRRINSLSKEN